MGWFEERFIEDADRLRFDCVSCARPMFFPKSKFGKYKTCGGDCADEKRKAAKEVRKSACETCGVQFIPRGMQLRAGCGKYCSQKCNVKAQIAVNSKQSQVKSKAAWKARNEINPIVKSGPLHPMWKGGRAASRAALYAANPEKAKARCAAWRKANHEKAAASCAAWAKANPEAIRIIKHNRSARKRENGGVLSKGLAAKLFKLQRGKCPCCKQPLGKNYHLDHIHPVARGGPNIDSNMQLLRKICNLQKHAKHPIDFMQSRGSLL